MKSIVHLEILTFAGYDPDARHYYGQLKGNHKGRFKAVELKYKLDKKSAQALSKGGEKYRAGSYSQRFRGLENVRKVAIKTWHKHFPNGDILVEGNCASLDPQLCLDAEERLKNKINTLYEEAVKIGWYEGDEKRMEEISDKYLKLIEWGQK